ncbi:MAG: uracil phosphoribosyltransferase [Mycoplasmataceae bacterium]|jgi:uracil phosphoribosyltransferase|nr:uracil phosphoribosyltransferase [Mycoplasmataceae bacterium]
MSKIIEIKHPVIIDKLSVLRNKNTTSRDFRTCLLEITQLMAYEVTKNQKLVSFSITTPIQKTTAYRLKDKIVLVPILRAGLGMVDGFKALLPDAAIGHIGLYRDEKTLSPVKYYAKFPDSIKGADVIILDPMLATGNSLVSAIDLIKERHPKTIKVACILAAPQGIKQVMKYHRDVMIFTTAVDQKLDKNGYIVPGLGDAGDRIFGTK